MKYICFETRYEEERQRVEEERKEALQKQMREMLGMDGKKDDDEVSDDENLEMGDLGAGGDLEKGKRNIKGRKEGQEDMSAKDDLHDPANPMENSNSKKPRGIQSLVFAKLLACRHKIRGFFLSYVPGGAALVNNTPCCRVLLGASHEYASTAQ